MTVPALLFYTFSMFLFLLLATLANAQDSFRLATESPELYRPLLAGKRYGLVVNQASLTRGKHSIDLLIELGLKPTRLFALEHGIRGEGGAGEEIGDSVDEKTGIPIYSLYGDKKKPDAERLRGLNLIVFDMQDVGVRFFTYISSLGLIMEAAAEQGIPVVVFDRPNPNDDYVAGPVLKLENQSFVGQFPIPLVYGLTIGELARMIHGERWQQTNNLDLTVIPMQGYRHGLLAAPEAPPSPGLRELKTMRLYPGIALFEPTILSVGKGTEKPYLQYGLPEERIGAHSFVPHPKTPGKVPMYSGLTCYGEEFYSRELSKVPQFTFSLFAETLGKVKRRPFVTDRRFLELLVGDKRVVSELLAGKSDAELRLLYQDETARFAKKREKYFLYR